MSWLAAAIALAAVAQGGTLRGQLPAGADGLTLDGRPVPTDAQGRWIIGIGRDQLGEAWLGWFDTDGETGEAITIAPRQWRVENLPGLAARPVPQTEYDSRRPAEVARITAVRAGAVAHPHDADGWAARFTAPADGAVTGVFGSQRILGNEPQAPHSGLDLGAAAGSPARAPAAGIVRLADGPFTLEGNLVMIDHGLGLVSALLHLARIDVVPGQYVAAGETIGAVGATGRATGPHLHWSVTWGTTRLDPALLLGQLP
ncbi:hypothetical protein IP88_14085 [alpha proteobacterium AAP81b]|nr:hypothetical protein IP88_14085 [alpha proteobacterium AAP81b]